MKGLNETLHNNAQKSDLENNLDQMYLLIMSMLIQLMQTGFAFVEASVVRSKNVTNIMMKNLLDVFVAAVAYWLIGFAVAYGPGNSFIGWHHFATSNLPTSGLAFFFFQYVISATASTIISGAVAERCEMVAYFAYSFCMTGFIYPMVTRWTWSSDGWLNQGMDYEFNGTTETISFYDFAGSGTVHLCGGTAALLGAIILGPRIGRFHHETNTVIPIRGHSAPLAAFGTLILLIGFLAFNGGSQQTISQPGDGEAISVSMVNTIISAGMAGYTSLLINRVGIRGRTWNLINTVNGALAGMVAICSCCNALQPWGAAIVGIVAGSNFNFIAWLLAKLKIDDPADCVGVHFGGGIWGVLSVAFLKNDTGILMNWDRRSGIILGWQLAGICTIITWTGCLSGTMFAILKKTGLFRVSEEMERKGLDVPKHGSPAFPWESYGHGHVETIFAISESGQLSSLQIGYQHDTPRDGTDAGMFESPEAKVMNFRRIRAISVLQIQAVSGEDDSDTVVKLEGHCNGDVTSES
jgi:Amt family ammonium transporter